MLAKSTRGSYESRLRTWNRLAFEGRVPAWPITTRTLEVIGAAFRAGAYRSAKECFLAAFRYQEHDLRLEVDPLLRRFANRVIKAIVTTARSDVASTGGGAASKASKVTGEIPASTKRSVLAANPAMLRTPARARAGSASDWPARSARATSSAKEPRRELMVRT